MTRPSNAPSDEQLVQYLLGSSPDQDAARFDEASIADDEFAGRLRALEHDLVDAYVSGELAGDRRKQFEAIYLASSSGRARVRFAEDLARRAAAGDGESAARRPFRWGWALAASLFVVVSAYVGLKSSLAPRVAAPGQTATIAPAPGSEPAPVSPGASSVPPALRAVLSFVLLPATRGIADVPAITVPSGTREIELRLQLESDEFPRYQAVLKDPASRRTVWTSPSLPSISSGGVVVISIVPRLPLKPQRYVIDVSGFPARGRPQIVSSYPFRVVE
jgi:hypothetical protein